MYKYYTTTTARLLLNQVKSQQTTMKNLQTNAFPNDETIMLGVECNKPHDKM